MDALAGTPRRWWYAFHRWNFPSISDAGLQGFRWIRCANRHPPPAQTGQVTDDGVPFLFAHGSGGMPNNAVGATIPLFTGKYATPRLLGAADTVLKVSSVDGSADVPLRLTGWRSARPSPRSLRDRPGRESSHGEHRPPEGAHPWRGGAPLGIGTAEAATWTLKWSPDSVRDGLHAFEGLEDDRVGSHPGVKHICPEGSHWRFDLHTRYVDTSTDRQRDGATATRRTRSCAISPGGSPTRPFGPPS